MEITAPCLVSVNSAVARYLRVRESADDEGRPIRCSSIASPVLRFDSKGMVVLFRRQVDFEHPLSLLVFTRRLYSAM